MVFCSGLDLNCPLRVCDPAKQSLEGANDVRRQVGFRAGDGSFSAATFRRCVTRHRGEHKVKSFSCLDQYLCMAFAQLTYRESLRDIEACLRSQSSKLYHLGIRATCRAIPWPMPTPRATGASTPTLRSPDRHRPAALRQRTLWRRSEETVYALDATTIDLCLSVFPWAPFRSTKAAIKLHTLLDLRGNIPSFIFISDGKLHDVNILDQLVPEPGAFYVMDRGYIDFERLYVSRAGSFFVTRAKSNLKPSAATPIPWTDHRLDPRSDRCAHRVLLAPGFRYATAANRSKTPRRASRWCF